MVGVTKLTGRGNERNMRMNDRFHFTFNPFLIPIHFVKLYHQSKIKLTYTSGKIFSEDQTSKKII